MEILLDKINISLVIAILLNFFLGVMVFFNGSKRKINVVYSLNIVAIVGWLAAMFFYRSASPENNMFWCTILYIAPTFIASSFLYFTYIFPSQKAKNVPLKAIIIFAINLIIVLMVAWPGFIIKEVNVRPGLEKEIIFTKFYVFYFLYTLGFFSFGFTRLFKKYKKSLGVERLQIRHLLVGYATAANLAFVTNLIMPWIGFFFLNWLGQIFTVIMVAFTSYAITRYNLMNIKVVAAEFFSGLLIVASLVPIFEAKIGWELVIRITILAITVFFAVLIVRSVLAEIKRKEAEIKRREEVESLNKQLKKVSKELERKNIHLKKLLEMRSEFLDIASHQLKTPVSVILGTSSMFKEGTMEKLSKEEQAHFIDNIFQKAKKLNSIISDILRASEMDTEEFKLDEKIIHPTPLEEVAQSVYEDLKDLAEERNLEFSLIKPEKSLPRIMADPDFLSHAIFNLADNAIKYTSNGSVKMALSEDKGRVILKISDTGIGIPSADRKKMFDKFARAKNAVNMYTDGSGLGLFIVKKITEAHPGGKIGFESQENKGTTFTISFPGLKK